jgi:hypothetical protein
MTASILTFPRQTLRVAEQSPAAFPFVDQDGGRVTVNGRLWKAFVSESNAARVAEALSVLASLDALSPVETV